MSPPSAQLINLQLLADFQDQDDVGRSQRLQKDGKVVTTRTYATGQVGNVFKAAGIALPLNVDERQA